LSSNEFLETSQSFYLCGAINLLPSHCLSIEKQ
jgi:hypothetical protein